MAKRTTAERVTRRHDKMRAAGLRPIQIWVPDTRAPHFVAECRRQSSLLAQAAKTAQAQAETAFWELVTADAWNDLG